MEYTLEIILGLFIAVVALGLVAKKLKIPYPIVLVIGGLLLSFIPKLPKVELDPDLIFLTILPPILFAGGFFTSPGAFRFNAAPISMLAVGLVVITTFAVAAFIHGLGALSWPAAFLLGAVVSPTDAIAATAITQRLKVAHPIITVIDGESLVNDASALVIYRLVLGTMVAGTFSFFTASLEFIAVCIGGVAFGLIFGFIATKILKQITDAALSITISLILPFLSYLSADVLHMSGVLAAVTAGLYVGKQMPLIVSPIIRLEAHAIWRMIIFLLNGAAFILIGLQLPYILIELRDYSLSLLIFSAFLLNIVVIVVRLLWVGISIYLPVTLVPKLKVKYPYLTLKHSFLVGWCGMRGVVSLAAALALPMAISGRLFPERSLIIFLTFTVIFATLIFQGLTLPFIIRKLKILDDTSKNQEEAAVRLKVSQAAISKLIEITKEREEVQQMDLAEIHLKYHNKIYGAKKLLTASGDEKARAMVRLQLELLHAEREKIVSLRNQGIISNDVARRILNDIDFEAVRLQQMLD